MTSFESMKSKLATVGIYNFDHCPNLTAELKAYAAGLEVLFDTLNIMERECFIDTAVSYGLAQREKLTGAEQSGFTTTQRREMLKDKEKTVCLGCTVEAFENVLKSYGLSDFSIHELPALSKVGIAVNEVLSEDARAQVRAKIENDFPAHLTIAIKFSTE